MEWQWHQLNHMQIISLTLENIGLCNGNWMHCVAVIWKTWSLYCVPDVYFVVSTGAARVCETRRAQVFWNAAVERQGRDGALLLEIGQRCRGNHGRLRILSVSSRFHGCLFIVYRALVQCGVISVWTLSFASPKVENRPSQFISLAFLHWVRITFHPWPFVSDIAVFVLKRDVKLQLTN